MNSMMRSDYYLYEPTLLGKPIDNLNTFDDGILTANEIANLDLPCHYGTQYQETGLSDIKGSQGVFGFYSAFKKWQENIIMSL
jgi:hypothetical protein